MLAISFVTPLLLLGIAAAAIPLLLHLLSSVKAVETRFPSLRFLKLSMEKTARRRKIQHWLLMLLRAALLGLLAVAVAQPLSDAAGGWLGPSGSAAVIVLDNSYSMAAEVDGERRFDRARQMARRILTAENPPALAALMTTTGGGPTELTGDLTACQDRLDAAAISFGPDGLAQRVADGIDLLAAEGSAGTRALYILTDLQATSMQQLQRQRALAEAEGIHLLLIDTAAGRHVGNMGIVDLDVLGPRMVDAGVQVLVTVSNSSPTAQVAQVGLRIEGVAAGQTKVVNLAAAGRDGSTATLQFEHRFERPGPVAGEAYLLSAAGAGQVTDDLPIDNTRSFAIDVAERARALIVSPGQERQENPAYSPSLAPELLLGPRRIRWPIVSRTQAAAELSAESLQNVDIAYLCELPSFTPGQGRALAEFVAEGGKAVFFLGPRIDPDNYARSLVARAGPLLPVRPGRAVGQLGDQAEAIEANYVNLAHPYLAGLFAQRSDYLPNLLIQRYWQLQPRLNPMVAAGDQSRPDRPVEVLIRLANGDPLAIAADYGRGQVVVFTAPASFRWSLLPRSATFAAMLARMATVSPQRVSEPIEYVAGAAVSIAPDNPEARQVQITPPGEQAEIVSLDLLPGPQGPTATFRQTGTCGLYRWESAGGMDGAESAGGIFAVNPPPGEGQLERLSPSVLAQRLQQLTSGRVYVADSLESAHAMAQADATGRNWWDLLLIGVLLLLVLEAVVANRRSNVEAAPAGELARRSRAG